MCKTNADCTLRLNSKDGTFPSWEELSVLRIALFDDTDNQEALDEAIASEEKNKEWEQANKEQRRYQKKVRYNTNKNKNSEATMLTF